MVYLPVPRGGASGLGASDMEASRRVAAAYDVALPASYTGCLSQQMHLIWDTKCKAWQSIQPLRGLGQAETERVVNGVRIRPSGRFTSGDWAGWTYCAMAALPVCGQSAAAATPQSSPVGPEVATSAEATIFGVSRTGLLIAAAVLLGGAVVWKVVSK